MNEVKRVILTTVPVMGLGHLDEEERDVAQCVEWGDVLRLKRHPTNPHDKNAIAVIAEVHMFKTGKLRSGRDRVQIGWIPKKANKVLAAMMDGEQHLYAKVSALHEMGHDIWIDIIWRRPLTQTEKAGEVVAHTKKNKKHVDV